MASELSRLKRDVLVSLGLGPEILIPVRPSETTSFAFDLADDLWLPPRGQRLLVRTSNDQLVYCCAPVPVWCRRPDIADNHYVPAHAEFNTETRRNTLGATVWKTLFPSDYQEQRELFVPFLGRIIWKRLVNDRKIPGDAPIVAIDVETGDYRLFDDMVKGLEWAESLGRPTIYFNRYEPGFWRANLRKAYRHGD